MLKYFTSLDTQWDDLSATFVEATSSGVDHDWLIRKTAGEQREWLRDLKPIPDHELIHLLAVGDDERYGINRNGDGFSRDDNQRVHGRFVKNAKFFRDHKNDLKKDPHFGHPVASYHNDDMDRIELVIAAHKKTAADFIHTVASGDDAAFSMGADLAFDRCKVCGHLAKTAKQHCEHLRRPNVGRVLANGKVCGCDNPNPHYMDISGIGAGGKGRPADRIAYSVKLLKAAAATDQSEVLNGAELAEHLGLILPESGESTNTLRKWATLRALAAMEKQIPVDATVIKPAELDTEGEGELGKAASKPNGLKSVMEALHSKGILLKPKQFFRITVGVDGATKNIEPIIDQIKTALRSIFSDSLEDGASGLTEESRFDGGGDEADLPSKCRRKLAAACLEASVDPVFAEPRAMRNAIVDPAAVQMMMTAMPKTASVAPGEAARGYAALYAAYQLAFASHSHNHSAAFAEPAIVCINQE